MLISAISPYEFHARAIGMYTALTLCDRTVTALPTDSAGDMSTLRPSDVPRTVDAARVWAWSGPLWDTGVLVGGVDSDGPLEEIADVCDEIEGVDAWAPIRPMVDARLFAEPRARVEAIARDLAHGGINPGVTVPVSCGLARYAGRHGLLLFRSPANSTVTKLEARGTKVAARCAVPIFEGIDGDTLLEVRNTLEPELAWLRTAITETMETSKSLGVSDADLHAMEREALQPAAGAFESAFAEHRRVLSERAEDEGCRYRVRSVTLSFGHADADGVLRAASTAAMTLRGQGGAISGLEGTNASGVVGRRALGVCTVGVRRLAPTLV